MTCLICEDGGLLFRDTGRPRGLGDPMTMQELLVLMRPCTGCERGRRWSKIFIEEGVQVLSTVDNALD